MVRLASALGVLGVFAMPGVHGLALGDLNGDGYPDIAAARSDAPNVVYLCAPGSESQRR